MEKRLIDLEKLYTSVMIFLFSNGKNRVIITLREIGINFEEEK